MNLKKIEQFERFEFSKKTISAMVSDGYITIGKNLRSENSYMLIFDFIDYGTHAGVVESIVNFFEVLVTVGENNALDICILTPASKEEAFKIRGYCFNLSSYFDDKYYG